MNNTDKLIEALNLVTSFKEDSRYYKEGIRLWKEVERDLRSNKDDQN